MISRFLCGLLLFATAGCNQDSSSESDKGNADQKAVSVPSETGSGSQSVEHATEDGSSESLGRAVNFEVDDRVRKQFRDIVANNDVNGFVKLLDEGLPVNETIFSQPILLWASQEGHAEMVELLLNRGASADIQREDGASALFLASLYQHPDVVEILLKSSADPNIQATGGQQFKEGETALMYAALADNREIVELLLEAGADASIQSKAGLSAFKLATAEVKELFRHEGYSPSAPENLGLRALEAVERKDLESLEAVFQEGLDVNRFVRDRPLLTWAVLEDNPDMDVVQFLIGNGASLNIRSRDGESPLLWASWMGHPEIVEILLDAGAEVNITNEANWTPIFAASLDGHVRVVEILINNGADTSVKAQMSGGDRLSPLENVLEAGPRYIDNYNRIVELLRQAE